MTENCDDGTAAVVVRVSFDEAIGGDFLLRHLRSEESGLVESEIAESSVVVAGRYNRGTSHGPTSSAQSPLNPSYIFPKEAKKRSSSAERLPPSSLCLPAIDDRRGTAEVAPPPLRLRPLPSAFRLPSASRNRRPTDRSSTAEASVFALCHPPSSLCLPAIDHGPPKGHRRSMSTGNSSVPQNPHTLNSVVGESNENMNEVNEQAEGVERVGLHLDGHDTPLNEETETQQEFQTNKRKKTSGVWVDFEVVNVAGVQKILESRMNTVVAVIDIEIDL
nr:zinc finger BED domain-containing protein RICESLEEPER 2-like [Ipomoea batatas]